MVDGTSLRCSCIQLHRVLCRVLQRLNCFVLLSLQLSARFGEFTNNDSSTQGKTNHPASRPREPEENEALLSALDNPLREFGKKCSLDSEIILPMPTIFLTKFTQHSLWRRDGVKSRSVPLCPLVPSALAPRDGWLILSPLFGCACHAGDIAIWPVKVFSPRLLDMHVKY
jgi:hypothetical protein